MQNNRARIFMPFDALKGFRETLKRVEEVHDNKYIKKESIEDKIKKLIVSRETARGADI